MLEVPSRRRAAIKHYTGITSGLNLSPPESSHRSVMPASRAVARTSCSAAEAYRAALPARFRREAQILADATGWSQKDIEARMNANGQSHRKMSLGRCRNAPEA
jgi:hypothetical protein